MISFENTQQADLVTSAARAIGPEALFQRVFDRLAQAGLTGGVLVLLPVAAREILATCSGPGWISGAGVLRQVLGGNWQTLLGLPDALAQGAAVPVAGRVLIAECLLEQAAEVVTEEVARLAGLAVEANQQLPVGWDAQEPTTEDTEGTLA